MHVRDILLGREQRGQVSLSLKKGPTDLRRDGAVSTVMRSRGYANAVRRLDAGAGSRVDVGDIVESVLAEFGFSTAVPLGLVGKCYLGDPYEVHVLDVSGAIVEHFTAGQNLPSPFQPARSLALHPAYLAVEVYADRLVCLREDGSAIEIVQHSTKGGGNR